MLIAGIDEAGRGPVIGPLVMAGISVREEDIPKLKEMGVRDSKELLPAKREELFRKILAVAESYKIIAVSAEEIDSALASDESNLNILEAGTTSSILNEITADKVYIDLPDRNPERYKDYIRKSLVKKDLLMIAEHKADANYEIVGAASILAKVTRDRYIELLKEQFGEDFGSGYMSDPKTQEFLKRHWSNDSIHFFRKNWASYQNMKKEKGQKKLFDY